MPPNSVRQALVIWSPGWIYDWPTSLAFLEGHFYIGTRGQGVLRFTMNNQVLVQVKEFDDHDLKEVQSVQVGTSPILRHGVVFKDMLHILVNGTEIVPIAYFDEWERRVITVEHVVQ